MVVQPYQPAPSRDTVTEISQYLAAEVKQIEAILLDVIDSDSRQIREVGEYICLAGGKKLRPLLNLLATRAFSPAGEVSVQIAAALELIHVATLMHDDVIDGAAVRRGHPSVNARWSNEIAILMADYLYATAFDLLLTNLSPRPLQLITKVTRRMCEGEMYQIERRGRWLTPDDYLEISTCKTGYLFSACAALAGELGGLPAPQIAQLAAFGLDFGLAFQITDDALDYTADTAQWGKSVGIDLASGKQTLPLILALEQATEAERRQAACLLDDGGDPQPILDLMARHRGIERALELARTYAGRTRTSLAGLTVHDATAYDYLLALPEYVTDRRF